MKRPILLALIIGTLAVSIVLVMWAYARVHYPLQNVPLRGNRIVAFGDSLVVGIGADPGSDWVSVVSRSLGLPIVNAGVAGDTTASALARIDTILEPPPDLVIVLLGGNDALQRLPVPSTIQNLRAIIEKIQERGAAVLLLGVRGGIIGDPYHRELAGLARQTRAGYVPNILDSVWGNSHVMADEIHPNNTGYYIIANRLMPYLEHLLGTETRPRSTSR